MPLICIPLISQAKDLALARERLSLEVHLESEASRNTEAESLWYEVKGVATRRRLFYSRIFDEVALIPSQVKDTAILAREGFSKPGAANSLAIAT